MQVLRFVGVHEDGEHLLLAGAEGERFRLPLSEELVQAARMPRPKVGQRTFELAGEARPRDIQAMVRSGMTAAEVAERSGWDIEKVRKFEAPVLAERDHVAALARAARLRPRGSGHGGPTLANRVVERLTQRGVVTDNLSWDSWRSADGSWAVVLTFAAGGRQRQATWAFDPATSQVHAADDEARWLTEEERSGLTGPIALPGDPPLTAPPGGVYDVEAGGPGPASPAVPAAPAEPTPSDDSAPAPEDTAATTPSADSPHPPAPAPDSAPPQAAATDESPAGAAERRGPVDLVAAVRERSGARVRGRGARRKAGPPSRAATNDSAALAAAAIGTPKNATTSPDEPHVEGQLSLLDDGVASGPADTPDPVAAAVAAPSDPEPAPEQPETVPMPVTTPGVVGSAVRADALDEGATTDTAAPDRAGGASATTDAATTDAATTDAATADAATADARTPAGTTPAAPTADTPSDPAAPQAPPAGGNAATSEAAAAESDENRSRRTGRPSVPSWDDIVFGTKRDGSAEPRR